MTENLGTSYRKISKNAVYASVSSLIFLATCILGEGLGGSLGSNPMCYKYLGCTTGFAGYDAVEHFLFGIAAVFILIWFFEKFSKYSLLFAERSKSILMIVALIMFVSGLWEFFEFSFDVVRVDILHQALINWKLHINLLSQPTNTDTMGDLFFAFTGSTISSFFAFFINK